MGHSQSYDLRNPEFYEVEPADGGTVRGVRRISKEHQTDTVYDNFDLREEELRERIRREELRRQGAELESLRIRNESQHGGIIDAYRTNSPTQQEFNHYDELKHHSPVNPQILEMLYRLVDINNGEVLKFEPEHLRMYDTVPVDDSGYHRIRDLEPAPRRISKSEYRSMSSEFEPSKHFYHDYQPEVTERTSEVGKSTLPRHNHVEYQPARSPEVIEKASEVGRSTLPRHGHPEYRPRSSEVEASRHVSSDYQPSRIVEHRQSSSEVLERASEVGRSTLPRHQHPEYQPSRTPEVIDRASEVGKSTLPRHQHPEYQPSRTPEVIDRASEVGKSTLPRHQHPEYQPSRTPEVIDRASEVGKSTLPRHQHPEYQPSRTPEVIDRASEVGKSTLPRHQHPEYQPSRTPEVIDRASEVGRSTLPRHQHPEYQPARSPEHRQNSSDVIERTSPPEYQPSRSLEVITKASEVEKSTLPRRIHPEYHPQTSEIYQNPTDVINKSSELEKSTLPRHSHPEYEASRSPLTPRTYQNLPTSEEKFTKTIEKSTQYSSGPTTKFSSVEHYFDSPSPIAYETLPRVPEVSPHPTPRYVPPMTPTVTPRVTNISEIHAEKRLVVGVTVPPTVPQPHTSPCGIEYCTHVEVRDDEEEKENHINVKDLENVVDLAREEDIGHFLTSTNSRKKIEEKLFYQPYLPTLSLDRRPVVGYYDKLP